MKEMKRDKARRGYTFILGIMVLALLMLVSIAGAAPYAYVTNYGSSTVSIIDTASNAVISTVPAGSTPYGIAVNPNGSKVYVTNFGTEGFPGHTVSVIDMTTNTVTANVLVEKRGSGVAVNPDGKKVYVTNYGNYSDPGNTVSIIDTATNTITATIKVGKHPWGVAINPAGTKAYVTNLGSSTVSVINTSINTVTATVSLKDHIYPTEVVVNPTGTRLYVTNGNYNIVSVIDTASNAVIAEVNVGYYPVGVAVTPDGKKIYVAIASGNSFNGISVIDTATNKVTATVSVSSPDRVAVTPDGTKVYVVNGGDDTVSVIDTATNTVTATIPVGDSPSQITMGRGVESLIPVTAFSASPTSGKAPLKVAFIDKSAGSPTKWKWTFGDGKTSTIQNPTHKYSNLGNYTVSLTATNAEGNSTTIKTDYIKVVTKPVANFSAKSTSGKAPLDVAFTDTSTGVLTGWIWDFGDGSKSFLQSPIHKYSKAGIYTVNLTVKNAAGRDTVTKKELISVISKPVANFTGNITSGKAPLNVEFTDTSTGVASGWIWDFGDGSRSFVENPTHKYSRVGTYTVNLAVKNAAGHNTVTKTDYIKVVTKPVA
jgi:YVTN family beta-propeller protein